MKLNEIFIHHQHVLAVIAFISLINEDTIDQSLMVQKMQKILDESMIDNEDIA
jgi:hypothetical protein